LIGLPLQRYLHNDMIALEKKIAKQSGQGLIATDSLFDFWVLGKRQIII
jgi:8-amino-7-oxononanoate synthase